MESKQIDLSMPCNWDSCKHPDHWSDLLFFGKCSNCFHMMSEPEQNLVDNNIKIEKENEN